MAWKARQPEIDYSAADALREVSLFIVEMYGAKLDREEGDRAHHLNILADELRTAKTILRNEENAYDAAKLEHESRFGKLKEEDYTSQSRPVTDDVYKWYESRIEDKEGAIQHYKGKTQKMLEEINFINRVQTGLNTVSTKLGPSPIWLDPEDVTPVALAPQLVTGTPEEIAEKQKLIGAFFEERPEVVSPGALEVINLLKAEAIAKAEGRDWIIDERKYQKDKREEIEKDKILASDLALNPFVSSIKAIAGGDYNDEKMMDLILDIGTAHGQKIGDMLCPGCTTQKQYDMVLATYNTMASFAQKGTPNDITGLGRLVDNLTKQYEESPGKVGDLTTEKGFFASWVYNVFNINMETIDKIELEGYNPITKEVTKHQMSDMTPEKLIMVEFENSGLSKNEYFEKRGRKIFKLFKQVYGKKESGADRSAGELKKMIEAAFPKKKSEDEVAILREKLVNMDFEIVDVTADTGWYSVLAQGEGRLRLVKPLADRVKEAKNILEGKGINLQIGDSLVRMDVKEKQYQEWLAAGSKGATVAPAHRSFHTIGFAFDLDREDGSMNNPEIFDVLRDLGLVQSDTEWWHWSLEEV